MKISFSTWLAQFLHLSKGFRIPEIDEPRLRFVYYDAGRSPEKAVDSEKADIAGKR